MDRYIISEKLGEGSFGFVRKGRDKITNEIVAIKMMKNVKFNSLDECMTKLVEVKCLRSLEHSNIVKLLGAHLVPRERGHLFLVFEYMERNLLQVIRKRQDTGELLSEAQVRGWCFQLFHALAHMHHRGYFHRDLKPDNLLVTKDTIKIADFGMAKQVGSRPPYNSYVGTRWYRAPELLLGSSIYGAAIDMWAMGAIMAQLFTLRPLFPGSDELDQITRICQVLGAPNKNMWPNKNTWCRGMEMAADLNFRFPSYSSRDLSLHIPSAGPEAINLISALCAWDPSKRLTASEALMHPFFQQGLSVPRSLCLVKPSEPVTQTAVLQPPVTCPPCSGPLWPPKAVGWWWWWPEVRGQNEAGGHWRGSTWCIGVLVRQSIVGVKKAKPAC